MFEVFLDQHYLPTTYMLLSWCYFNTFFVQNIVSNQATFKYLMFLFLCSLIVSVYFWDIKILCEGWMSLSYGMPLDHVNCSICLCFLWKLQSLYVYVHVYYFVYADVGIYIINLITTQDFWLKYVGILLFVLFTF